MTRTSVSLALIIREVCPSSTACLTCSESRESARRHSFKTDKLVTHSPIFPCYDDNILLTRFNNFANKEVEEVSLIVTVPQKIAPYWMEFCLVSHPASCALGTLWPSYSFQTVCYVYIK